MKAPFPWFGGKRRVADQVWDALGDVDNYAEPFAGSLAVLLERPEHHKRWHTGAETVNDKDQFLANFWRALAHDPAAVAQWADWPVNEADLFARHLWLVNTGRERLAAMDNDPDFYDAKVAGWWVWGINAWIGSGWCSGTGPHTHETIESSKRPHLGDAGRGINRKLPHLGNAGQGIHRQLPHLGNAGLGINRKLPHLGNAGQGIHRQLPHLGNAGLGINVADGPEAFTVGGSGPANPWTNPLPDEPAMYGYLAALADRLRRVRVCCGNWDRIVTDGALSHGGTVGVFLDPPYLGDVRTSDLYSTDDHTIANDVRQWALDHGDNPRLRIVLAGYAPEHDHLIPDTWRRIEWSAGTGYSDNRNGNRHLERLWCSPHCLDPDQQLNLWGTV